MAANRAGTNDQLRWLGLPGIPTALALRCFKIAIQRPSIAQWLIGRFDWGRLAQQKRALWACFRHNQQQVKPFRNFTGPNCEGIIPAVLGKPLTQMLKFNSIKIPLHNYGFRGCIKYINLVKLITRELQMLQFDLFFFSFSPNAGHLAKTQKPQLVINEKITIYLMNQLRGPLIS
jgi:hypothetical protein